MFCQTTFVIYVVGFTEFYWEIFRKSIQRSLDNKQKLIPHKHTVLATKQISPENKKIENLKFVLKFNIFMICTL